jgi:hypothetical protein
MTLNLWTQCLVLAVLTLNYSSTPNMASKLLSRGLSTTRSLRALENPVFLSDKLLIAIKFDPVSTNILDTIASQYKCFQTTPSSKPYIRVLIRRCSLPHTHPEILGPAWLLHAFCRGISSASKSLFRDFQRTLFPSQTPNQQEKS